MALKVNGEIIEDSVIQEEAERLRPQYEKAFKNMDAKERETQLLEWSKENLIEKTLLHQDVTKNEPEVPLSAWYFIWLMLDIAELLQKISPANCPSSDVKPAE